MFDISGPEFLVICIVALVVLGPERLPEVMRKVGQVYRQARHVVSEYTGEARRMFEEGVREVQDVSATIASSWPEPTSPAAAAARPAETPEVRRLRQVPASPLAPVTAAAAGPWALPARYRDVRTEPELQIPAGAAPFALLQAAGAGDDLVGDLDYMRAAGDAGAVFGAPSGAASGAPESTRGAGTHGAGTHGAGTHGAGTHGRPVAPESPAAEHVRQEAVVALYRSGDVTLDKAAELLGLSRSGFRALLKRPPPAVRTAVAEPAA